jgi:phage terminase large subunit-like protein
MTSSISEFPPPYAVDDVRPDYHQGVWRYALGRPASMHDQYDAAIRIAQSAGWNPWWIRTWQDVDAVLHGCYIDESCGTHVCRFFEKLLVHTKASATGEPAGRPIRLMDWHKWDLLMPMFSWRRQDGTRRFRRASIWVSKKSGKSFLCSGLGLYFLTADNEPAAEVYSAANSRKQAGIIHDEAARMVRMSKRLRAACIITPSVKNIAHIKSGSKFEALASEAGTVEGLNWSALLFDEVHVQNDRTFFKALEYGGIARRQPYLIEISTAGVYDLTSIGWEEFTVARNVWAGAIANMELFAYIASAHTAGDKLAYPWVNIEGVPGDADDDIQSPVIQKKANPAIDITFPAAALAHDCRVAVDNPVTINDIKRYRFNIWVAQSVRWLPLHWWTKCRSQMNREEFAKSLEGKTCIGGLDLSMSNDITSLGLWFPPTDGLEHHSVLSFCWLPQDNIVQLAKDNKAPYIQWAEDGWLELTPGSTVNYAYIRERVGQLMARYKIKEIAFDPYNATETEQRLREEYGDAFMIAVKPGMLSMAPATKFVKETIQAGKLRHDGNPVLTWHVANAQGKRDHAGREMIVKGDGKLRYKVDAIVALTIAACRVIVLPEQTTSVYERRGIILI